jgi:hypothetical protein
LAESCRRLIKNTIMCWNYLYLSKKISDEKEEAKKLDLIESIKKDSVMRWAHFNLGGGYDFSEEKMTDSIGLKPPKNKLIKVG